MWDLIICLLFIVDGGVVVMRLGDVEVNCIYNFIFFIIDNEEE